jgi:hypothetical protein
MSSHDVHRERVLNTSTSLPYESTYRGLRIMCISMSALCLLPQISNRTLNMKREAFFDCPKNTPIKLFGIKDPGSAFPNLESVRTVLVYCSRTTADSRQQTADNYSTVLRTVAQYRCSTGYRYIPSHFTHYTQLHNCQLLQQPSTSSAVLALVVLITLMRTNFSLSSEFCRVLQLLHPNRR